MLEVEMKFRVADKDRLIKRLAMVLPSHEPVQGRVEVDHYFNAPDRDFGQTDEALRLRQIGDVNLLTYKGPKLDAQTKTRQEVEVRLADGQAAAERMCAILRFLRFRPTATLEKERFIHHLSRGGFELEVCVDEAGGLGTFVELEIVAREEELDVARRVVQDVARELGLTDNERRSYLEMSLERAASLPRTASLPRERGELATQTEGPT